MVVDVGLQLKKDGSWSQPSLRSVIKYLHAMPKAHPHIFDSLRRGVDRAASWMRYAMRECGSPDCDAFAVFKGLIHARAMNFTLKGPSLPINVSSPLNLPRRLPAKCPHKCTWALVSLEKGCSKNNQGIKERWRSYFFPTLDDCKMSCEADHKCAGIDFDEFTSLCITFPKACTSPKAQGFAFHKLTRS